MLVPWTKFEDAWYPPDVEELLRKNDMLPERVLRNSRYEVQIRRKCDVFGPGADVIWLSIKRIDKEPIDENHWRELQRIKNEVLGPEWEAVEIYPAESRMVDTSNQYHCWALPLGMKLPFGFDERGVAESVPGSGTKQRPWADDERPADVIPAERMKKALQDFRRGLSLREVSSGLFGDSDG